MLQYELINPQVLTAELLEGPEVSGGHTAAQRSHSPGSSQLPVLGLRSGPVRSVKMY